MQSAAGTRLGEEACRPPMRRLFARVTLVLVRHALAAIVRYLAALHFCWLTRRISVLDRADCPGLHYTFLLQLAHAGGRVVVVLSPSRTRGCTVACGGRARGVATIS